MKFSEMLTALEQARDSRESLVLVTLDILLEGRDPKTRSALEAAAIPHWFDAGILATLLQGSRQQAAATVVSLRILPIVEPADRQHTWVVQSEVRLALRKRLAKATPDRFRRLTERARDYYQGTDHRSRIESVYHGLHADPVGAAEQLQKLHDECSATGVRSRCRTWGMCSMKSIRRGTYEAWLARGPCCVWGGFGRPRQR